MKLVVAGTSCGHCVRTVTHAVPTHAAAAVVRVELAAGTVHVDGHTEAAHARAAIKAEGYLVKALATREQAARA